MESWGITLIALMVILFLSNWTKLRPSSFKNFEGYFTVSPKIFEIFFSILKMENCWTGSYGTMSFNFIERKESLAYIWIFRVFW
jgi:hypothetical protein